MCGIVGYTGTRPVKDILIEGLSRLEYRGYDSAGIAVEQDGKLEVVHCKGKVSGLAQLVEPLELTGTCGIGHTRWATHGRPSEANAHPLNKRIFLVNDGIGGACSTSRPPRPSTPWPVSQGRAGD